MVEIVGEIMLFFVDIVDSFLVELVALVVVVTTFLEVLVTVLVVISGVLAVDLIVDCFDVVSRFL